MNCGLAHRGGYRKSGGIFCIKFFLGSAVSTVASQKEAPGFKSWVQMLASVLTWKVALVSLTIKTGVLG